MEPNASLPGRLKELFADQRLAVLATHEEGQPYLSLMAFAAADDLKTLVVATRRRTRKFDNLTRRARVALLIDDRSNQAGDLSQAVAVTVIGKAEELEGAEKDRLSGLYLAKHPDLTSFAAAADTALVGIRVERYYLVSGFEEVRELEMG